MSPVKLDRILVPTDFSSIAANARRFAGGLARSLGAEHIQPVHRFDRPVRI